MKLRIKFLALGLACSALVATALGFSLWEAQFRAEQMTQMRVITEITQRHMEGDMMHDAMHADVLSAILAGRNNDAAGVTAAADDFARHGKIFHDNLEANRGQALPAEVKTPVEGAWGLLPAYEDGGKAVISAIQAGQDYSALNQDFEGRFEALETAQSDISDHLAKWGQTVDADTQARAKLLGLLTMILSVAAIAGVLLMTFAQWIGILKPLGKLTSVIEALARGDDRVEPGYGGRTDEIGILAKAMDVLRGGLSESFLVAQMVKDMPSPLMTVDVHGGLRIRYANPAMDRLGAVLGLTSVTGRGVHELCSDSVLQAGFLGNAANLPCSKQVSIGQEVIDLSISPVFDRQGAYQAAMIVWRPVTDRVQLSRDFEQTIQTLVDSVAEGASQVAGAASGMRSGLRSSVRVAVNANEAAGQTASNVNTVAAAAEELSASVREISAQIQTTNSLVRESHARVQNADNLALKLSAASERVNEVTRVIADISGQINLLALNATIESARAGEAGRGFAVVANEVKTLANQTNRSIGEINGVIDEMRGASGEIITALHAIKDSVEQITQATTSVAAAVEEQSATTEDIAKNMAYAADGTRVISSNLQEVSDSTGQAETVSQDLHGSSQSLSEQVSRLRGEVGAFLHRMNAA